MESPKKIVFISNMAAPYQIENCKYLNKYTINQYYFLFCSNLDKNRPGYWGNIPFRPINTLVLEPPLFFINFDVIKELKLIDPDVIIIGGYNLLTGIYAAIWGKLNNKEMVLYLERFLPSCFYKRQIKKIIFYCVSNIYDKHILVGNDAYKEYFFLKNKKNIPYLINIDRYRNKEKKYFQGDFINFLYSGRFSSNQNVNVIVNAFLRLCGKHKNIRLVLSGNGEGLAGLKKLIHNSGYKERIKIDNSYKSWFDIPSLYKLADVLLAPLNHSGWGFVVEEAMAAGLAVISTYETTSAAEYIIDNYNGFMVDMKIDSIEESMDKYINDKELIKKHGDINKEIKIKVDYKYIVEKFDRFVSGGV